MAYTTIDNPELYFQVKLYTGNGTDDTDITLGAEEDMQPDMIWFNCRSHAEARVIHDSVRGVHERIFPGAIDAEGTATNALQAFLSDGWTMGVNDQLNSNTKTYVAWCWKAGTTSGITTDGSTTITPSSYSFNQTSGIAILRYTGNSTDDARLAHGLGGAAEFLVCKEKDVAANNWAAWHSALGNNVLALDDTPAQVAGNSRFSNNPPDAVNITLGSDDSTNKSGNMLCYAFKGVQGYSKFGQYEGNGNADGPFVYTGFRPAWIMTKSIDSTSEWHIFDDQREGYNVDNDALTPEGATELTTDMIDILSNGFKCRTTGDPNVAETYIYAAFAKAPFVNSEGVPNNAR